MFRLRISSTLSTDLVDVTASGTPPLPKMLRAVCSSIAKLIMIMLKAESIVSVPAFT